MSESDQTVSDAVVSDAVTPDAAAAAAPDAAAQDARPLSARLEAVLLAADRPVDTRSLAAAVAEPEPRVARALAGLQTEYDGPPERGFELRRVAGGWQLYVRAGYEDAVRRLVDERIPPRLSQAALETLAVIAYRQPISRGQISAIRAVNVDGVVRTLVARGLVEPAYVDEATQATLFRTTDLLLAELGVDSLDELPPISNLLPEDPEETDGERD
ncbi:MAG: SMC-Scp complex subunit ScpB [Pseudoclavibacter caeni]|jgi:segregation and condensation protein B